jgi:flavin reductase (DIM6/NTAB) family NADH-FMN oxidoreductase RutF
VLAKAYPLIYGVAEPPFVEFTVNASSLSLPFSGLNGVFTVNLLDLDMDYAHDHVTTGAHAPGSIQGGVCP